jgi:hypothetical protein
MKISRRNLLRATGVTTVVVVGGGVYRAVDQGIFAVGQGPAYEPWQNWQDSKVSPVERIVRAGILAANPHNSQPWIFQFSNQQINLFADVKRQIGTIDSLRREMYIGLGCAIENMTLATQAEGYIGELTYLPDPHDQAFAATMTLSQGLSIPSDLYGEIPHRHTNRGPYDRKRGVDQSLLDAMCGLQEDTVTKLFWFTSPDDLKRVGKAFIDAVKALIADEQQSIDSHHWWRQSWADIQRYHDGLTIDAQTLDEFTTFAGKMLPDFSRQQNDQSFLKNAQDIYVPTSPAFGLIAVQNQDDLVQRMQCGRLWQRMHLWGTKHGLGMHPQNAICERADRERQLSLNPHFGDLLQSFTGSADWQGIMPFRIGYPLRTALASPRRSVQEVTH